MDFFKECMSIAAPLGIDFSTRQGIGEEINYITKKYLSAERTIEYTNKYYSNLVNKEEIISEYENIKNMCMAALYIRFNKSMYNFYAKVKNTSASQEVSFEDLPSVFFYRFKYTAKYIQRKLDAGEDVNCQQFINRSIQTEVENLGHRYGMYDKYMAVGKCSSMDKTISTDKDGNEKTLGDTIPDQNSCSTALGVGITIEMYIQDYFNKNKFDYAIIIDAIGHNEAKEFSTYNVRKYINHLTEKEAEFYATRYHQNIEIVSRTIDEMQKLSPGKLDKCISQTLAELRKVMTRARV